MITARDERVTASSENRFYRRLNLSMFIAGALTGILALSRDAWWLLEGVSSNRIITIRASPFFLETDATGLSSSSQVAMVLGMTTRFLVAGASLLLILLSVKRTVWWRNLAQWFNLASIIGMFLSFAIMINIARQQILAEYGVVLPLYGRLQLPVNMLGLDFRFYASPVVSASFGLTFYLGILSLMLVGSERIMSLRSIEVLASVRKIREFHLVPPYRRVWMVSDDKSLNPLWTDPGRATDEQLIVSFGNLYNGVEPGGLVRILVPSWAGWVGDRIQEIVRSVGFRLDSTRLIREGGQDEIELRMKKPVEQGRPSLEPATTLNAAATDTIDSTNSSTSQEEPEASESIGGISLESSEATDSSPPVTAASLSPTFGTKRQLWPTSERASKEEAEIVKAAARTIANIGTPVEYRQLLSEVYKDLLTSANGDSFATIRDIESALLKHVGEELVLIDDTGADGRLARKWWIGENRIGPEKSTPRLENLGRIRSIKKIASLRLHALKTRFRKEERSGYRPRRRSDDE